MQDLTQFDPNVEKLTALVAESRDIVKVNLDDQAQLETVKRARIKLRDARVSIEKTGKAYREDALAYQRAVITKEKELIAIIEPEETRLKLFEKSAELAKERRLRVAQLPERRERLEKAGFAVNESVILEMDSVAFEMHFNGLVAEKNQKEREEQERIAREKEAELKAREDALKAAENKIEEEKRAREREEKARQEERERIEHEAKEKAYREEIERAAKEKAEREAKEKLEKQKKYQKFLAESGWTKETASDYKEENIAGVVTLWKKVGTYKS